MCNSVASRGNMGYYVHMHTQEILDIIRSSGRRVTKARHALVSVFAEAEGPLSLSGIRDGLRSYDIDPDRTTVYRELRYLLEEGIVTEVHVSGSPVSYERVSGHRHHLVCLGCHEVRSVPFDEHLKQEEERILSLERFRVLDHSLEYYGYCEHCRGVSV